MNNNPCNMLKIKILLHMYCIRRTFSQDSDSTRSAWALFFLHNGNRELWNPRDYLLFIINQITSINDRWKSINFWEELRSKWLRNSKRKEKQMAKNFLRETRSKSHFLKFLIHRLTYLIGKELTLFFFFHININ